MILLINPQAITVPRDTYDVPLGLTYIAGILIQHGYKVTALDFGRMSFVEARNHLETTLETQGPDLVGITSVSATYEAARDLLSIAKSLNPKIVTVHGGVHVSLATRQVVSDPLNNADVLVLGEGEETLLELAQKLREGKKLVGTPGTAVKVGKRYIFGPKRSGLKDLDALPLPARHIFDVSNIPVMRILTSRGCPYNCSFCASATFWDRRIRFHSPTRVIEEIDQLLNTFHCRKILIVDDAFTINQQRAQLILDELSNREADFSCLSRVDCISEPLLQAMVRANVSTISFGCESGNQDVLTAIRKGIIVKEVRNAIRSAKRYGIKTRTSWMWGLPYDSVNTLRDTIQLIIEEEPDEVVLYRFVPYPGTEIYCAYPELENLSPSLFHSGAERFLIPIGGMTIEEMEDHFQGAFAKLYAAGYSPIDQGGPNVKTATNGFSRFTSFWPEPSSVNRP